MKTKKLIYILIPLVLLIWGLIVFRIIKQIRHSQKPHIENASYSKNHNPGPAADSSSLILKYRDPFLHGNIRKISDSWRSDNFLSNNSNLSTVTKAPVSFPNTRYSGLVINSKNKQKLGLLKIDNKDFLVQEGDLVSGEKIIRIHSDSVIISFKKTKKTFFRD
jgi:hypothetical protein